MLTCQNRRWLFGYMRFNVFGTKIIVSIFVEGGSLRRDRGVSEPSEH